MPLEVHQQLGMKNHECVFLILGAQEGDIDYCMVERGEDGYVLMDEVKVVRAVCLHYCHLVDLGRAKQVIKPHHPLVNYDGSFLYLTDKSISSIQQSDDEAVQDSPRGIKNHQNGMVQPAEEQDRTRSEDEADDEEGPRRRIEPCKTRVILA